VLNKLVYISFLTLVLVFTSCKKEDIKSRCNKTQHSSPEWKSSNDINVNAGTSYTNDEDRPNFETNPGLGTSNSNTQGNGSLISSGTGINDDSDGGITDPNSEPDASKRKGKK
jgi:hypothetical protein